MKFTKIFTIVFTLAFAYAQTYDDSPISSDVEIPDAAGIEPQNTADNSYYNAENSDDYGDEAGINALDAMAEDSNDENAESNPSTGGSLSQVVSSDGTVPEANSPESTVPEATAPEVDAAADEAADEAAPQDAVPDLLDQKDEIPQDEIPLIKPLFTGASGEAAPIAAEEAKEANEEKKAPINALDDTSKTETSIDPAKIASGLVGAACLSSAGIFFMVKRSKRRGLESVRSQISMA